MFWGNSCSEILNVLLLISLNKIPSRPSLFWKWDIWTIPRFGYNHVFVQKNAFDKSFPSPSLLFFVACQTHSKDFKIFISFSCDFSHPIPGTSPTKESSRFCSLVRLEAQLWASSKTICSAGPTCHCWISFFPSPGCSRENFVSSCSNPMSNSAAGVIGMWQDFQNRFPTCKILVFSNFLPSNQTCGGDCVGPEGHQMSVFEYLC